MHNFLVHAGVLDADETRQLVASLESIGTFTHLRRLRLGETDITDAGLDDPSDAEEEE